MATATITATLTRRTRNGTPRVDSLGASFQRLPSDDDVDGVPRMARAVLRPW